MVSQRDKETSEEQKLDMCEVEGLRGDEITHQHGVEETRNQSGDPKELTEIMDKNWSMDMSEENREGDEMSGDEHSQGLQGGEPELRSQPRIESEH